MEHDTSKEKLLEKHEQVEKQRTTSGGAMLYVTFKKRASTDRKMHISISDGDYKLKHIKRLIWRNMKLAHQYRYFFKTWCPEVNQVILDEVCYENQVIPKWNNNVIVYLETKN